ncbi:MAG: hypothetical protein IJZ36_05250 [Bacilli bacterium]|nr:hypothetical protein [Bacilli bacterium]
MDSLKVVGLLEYIKTFDNLNSGATGIALDKAIESVKKLEQIKEIIKTSNCSSGEQSDSDNIIYAISNVLSK